MSEISNPGSRNGRIDGASAELMQMLRDLFRSLKDPIVSVREAVQVTLVELGMKRPRVMISYCHSVLKENLKKNNLTPVCTVVLDVLSAVLTELSQIPDDLPLTELIKTVCQFVEKESTSVGIHANKLLARLSVFHCTEVMEQLLAVIAKTERPLVNVIEVSGLLALHHTDNIMQVLPVLLTQTMKYLPEAADDQIRQALTITLGQYCDSVLEYLSVSQDALTTWNTVLELLSPHTCTAVDIILTTWVPNTKETVLLTSIYANFGSVASLTETNYLISQLSKMLNFFIVNWRRASSPVMGLALCQSLNTFISTVIRRSKTSVSGLPEEQPSMYQRTAESGSLLSRLGASPKLSVTSNPTDLRSAFASELDNVITCLFQHLFQIAQRQISVENSGYIETYTKVLREIKRAFATLGSSYPDRIWSAVQSHLTNGSELSRAVTVDLLRHLVSAGPSSPDRSPFSKSTQQQILNSVLRLLFGSGVPLPGFQRVSNSVISGATTTASAMAMTAPNRRSSLRHSLMGDVVHGAPLGPDRDSLLLGEIVSGENVAPLIRVELIKLVLTLGSLGYLDLEGGHILVEFVVRQCALTQTSLIAHDKESRTNPSPRQIYNLCVHVMKLSSTTVSAMRSVLWPFLLEFLLVVDCTEVVGVVCDSIANLLAKPQVNMDLYQGSLTASEKLGDSAHMEDISSQELRTSETSTGRRKSLPSPHKLFVRLVVLLGLPICGRNRGLSILRLMLAMARQIHPTLPVLWNLVLPQMTLYLNQDQMCHDLEESDPDADSQGNTSFSTKHWQELTLKMLLKSIEQIADEKWTVILVHEFEQQTSLYDKLPDERGFLYRCLGVTLSKIQHQQTVVEAAELIIQSTNHDSPIEQECCAEALGFLSTNHGELVMDLLTLQMNTLDSYGSISSVDKRGSVNRVQTGTSPNNTGVSLSTGTAVPVSSVQWRLTNLFRQHTSSKSDQVRTCPLPAHFRGSVEAARATMLRCFTRSFHYMPTTIALPRLDTILKKIVGPVIDSQDVPSAVRLALIELIGQLGRVIQSLDTVTFADGAADTPDSPIPALLALIYCLLEVLNQDFAAHSIQIPTVSSSATPGLLAFPDPTAPSASHPLPCVVSRTIRLKSVEAITGLLAADFVPTLISSSLLATTAMVFLCCRDSGDSADRLAVSKDIEVRPVVQEIAVSGDVQTSTNAEERNVINLWLRLIQIACSDELISAMIKTLVPHLYDPVAHVRYRTLRLCTALLTATLEQLKTVANEAMYALRRGATGLSLSGQLLGHLVARLGDTGCTPREPIRKQTKLALGQLLQIFSLLSIDTSASPSVEDEVGMESANLSEPQTLQSDRLLNDLVQHVPMTQIPGLLELIWSGILQCSGEAHRTDNADTPERDLSADESAAETTMQSDSVSGLIGSHGLCPSTFATTTSSHYTASSVIPRTEAGYLIRLLIVLLQHRSKHFKEELVGSIVHAVYSLYPNLLIPGLRAGVLLALAELGRNWPVLCLQTISANALPLNLTWSVILAAVAFLPVSRKTNSGPTSLDLTSSPKSLSSEIARTRSLPRLLKHVLHILECCLPYERREVPVDSVQWSTKRDHPNENSDCPTNKEVRFITQAYLAFVNCLQILSYPVYLDELIHYDHSEHWSLRLCVHQSTLCVKEPVRTKRRLFLRSSGSTTTAATTPITTTSTTAVAKHRFDSPRSSVAAFTAYLTEPSVFCQVLGYLLLSHATAAGCRTPIGKSYENRSGAEANLERGVQPLIISAEGLYGFLETCGLHPLLRLLTADSSKPMNKVDAHTSREATPNKTEPSQMEHKGLLWNPDLVLEVVEVIGRYVIENLSQAHIFGLVHFFLARLNSTYEPHRMVVTKWLACVLSRANGRTVSIVADPLVSEQGSMTAAPASDPVVTPDYLFGQLLSRLEDPCTAVRHIAVTGLGDIGNSVVLEPNSESKSTERSSSEHPAAKLIWRHSVAVTRGLFLILDDKSESDLSMLHDALRSLSYTLPYTNSHRIAPLIGEMCERLWPIYMSVTDSIRAAAFELFGTLTLFAWDPMSEIDHPLVSPVSYGTLFAEAQSVLIPVLLHLADPSPNVVDACKTTLKKLAPILFASPTAEERPSDTTNQARQSLTGRESEIVGAKSKVEGSGAEKRLLDFFNNCLRPDLKLHQGEFFNELARLLVTLRPDQVADYTMRCTVFYNSDWPEIQCSAVLFSGFLIGHFPDEILEAFPRSQVCHQLLQLLRSNNADVRATAAHAISRLYRF